MTINIFSVDLEEWFHILNTDQIPNINHWINMESRIVSNTVKLLNLLNKHKTRSTFFILGWVAEHYPELVKEIKIQGHQIGSHGYSHTLVYQQTPEEFKQDITRAEDAIRAACGEKPKAYRAPGFSITASTLWALDILAKAGYQYDASILPADGAYGGIPTANPLPCRLTNGLLEFPTSTLNVGKKRLPYLGGGYLRCLPLTLLSQLSHIQHDHLQPLVLYIHPRDIDPNQPRLNLPPLRQFKSYVGLKSTYDKLSYLLENFEWGSMNEFDDSSDHTPSYNSLEPMLA
ncbi:polysaccharide deacetylase family protein [Coleofasciculus sp. E1-EBD-02]|uniref:polysaccharide deacetylase family protein n=1 Tax=Coleofasciculus sp. E1-EBD-02 TaxID=3068481 RepID=UPI003302262B